MLEFIMLVVIIFLLAEQGKILRKVADDVAQRRDNLPKLRRLVIEKRAEEGPVAATDGSAAPLPHEGWLK
jgi:hypothetical protein